MHKLSARALKLVDAAVTAHRQAIKYRGSPLLNRRRFGKVFTHALRQAKARRQAVVNYAERVCQAPPQVAADLSRALDALMAALNPVEGPEDPQATEEALKRVYGALKGIENRTPKDRSAAVFYIDVAAAVMLAKSEGQSVVFVIQRADNGRWAFPGGRKERGETLETAAVRETKEEVGVDVQVVRRLGQATYPLKAGTDVRVTYFLCKPTMHGQRQVLAEREVQATRWVTYQELLALDVTDADQRFRETLKGMMPGSRAA
jgi:8-oxo-dGTP diphosphatase